MKYYLIAGEASGDLHASNLMDGLKKEDPHAEFRFFGGDLMSAKGGVLVKHYRDMAFMGFIPVLLNLKTILRNMKTCEEDIKLYNPDVVILIDYPGFNLKIAKFVKTVLNIPVYYYISPKIWAWKQYRIKSFKKYVDKMFCILPFEPDFFRKLNYKVTYVGNPSVDSVANRTCANETFAQFIGENQLPDKPVIALLAGSRRQEIKDNLPTMLDAVSGFTEFQYVIAGAPGIDPGYYKEYIGNHKASRVFDQTYRLLQQSKAALVTSGTATLETALFRVPQVVCYKTPVKKLVRFVFTHFFHIKYISLVNLIADKTVVQELFADSFSCQAIREELNKIIRVEAYRNTMLEGYDEVINRLGSPGASHRAARYMFESLSAPK